MEDGSAPSRFTREQKAGAVFLLVFSLLTVGLGALQFRNTIYSPFVVRDSSAKTDLVLDEDARLQQLDTDQDGLNDFEELNFYETSAYLPDSDSDGINDKEELDRGTNPLCPEGKNCEGVDATITTTSTPIFENPDVPTPESLLGNTQLLQPEDLQKLSSDPAALRELLVKSGKFSEADLAKIDDETLKKVAADIIAESAKTQPAQP